ncbi:MAG: hypothetical protein ABI162_05185 [Luteolibacter sp.]
MLVFKRFYIFSSVILIVIVGLSVIAGFSTGELGIGYSMALLAVAAVALFPIFWNGGILRNPRLSISIAVLFTITFASMVGLSFMNFLQSVGGEEPQGSPLANMMAIAVSAVLFICPWLFTSLHGWRHWNSQNSPSQS